MVTAGGARYVLKVAPLPETPVLTYERELMRRELRFYALLRGRTAVRTPRVLWEDLTRRLIPCDYFIMEFLPGQRLDKAKLNKEGKAWAAGAVEDILAQFHAVAGEGFGYEQNGLEPNWHLALRKMTRALADDCARFGRPCPLGRKLLGYIGRHRALLEAVPAALVNFDLHAMNIFVHGGELTILDLERCFWGDRLGDSVLRGYTMPKSAPKEEQIRFYLMEAYLALVMHTEKYARYRPWNGAWWLDVAGTVGLGVICFPALRRLSK
jgi:aminoglycoside phosphotransferase (APT) family kinase protein